MSWLPAIRFKDIRYWLPLSRPATDLFAAMLLEASSSGMRRASSGSSEMPYGLIAQLRQDPALAIFTAANMGPEYSGQTVTWTQLASHWTSQLSSVFQCGDSFLGSPTHREQLLPLWQELHRIFLQMPPSQWLPCANQWLSLTGPKLAASMKRKWPKAIEDTDFNSSSPVNMVGGGAGYYAESHLPLSVLARQTNRYRAIHQQFDDALQQAKMASIKQFAYGLSHEINNPLANISARAQGLLRDESDQARKGSLQRIIDQSHRAHEMVADLMFYAHPPVPHRTDVNFGTVLNNIACQLRATTLERGIAVRVIEPVTPIRALADGAMLAEATRALVRNAIEAIGCNGRIELSVRLREASKTTRTICVTVRDSGPGLSEEAVRHAFDPYFSGREAGRGLGVGLCRVERIAKLHGGGASLKAGPAGCIAMFWFHE